MFLRSKFDFDMSPSNLLSGCKHIIPGCSCNRRIITMNSLNPQNHVTNHAFTDSKPESAMVAVGGPMRRQSGRGPMSSIAIFYTL
jgi:hypothetical protein